MAFRKLLSLICATTFVCLQLFSCKKEKCPPTEFVPLDKDTALVPYTALETFKFVVKDSSGNFLDSLIFLGQGKRKYIGSVITPGKTGYGCHQTFEYEAMDYKYVNKNNPNHTFRIKIRKGDVSSEFFIILDRNPEYYVSYQGFTSFLISPQFPVFHDSTRTGSKIYYQIAQLKTSDGSNLNAYFGKYDGLLFLEETNNRIWYKVN